MVTRQNRWTISRQMLDPGNGWPEDQAQPRPDENMLTEPIEHVSPPTVVLPSSIVGPKLGPVLSLA